VTSRQLILSALRRHAPASVPLPDRPTATRFPDPVEVFVESVRAVGGTPARVADAAALDRELRGLPVWSQAKQTVSLVPGAGHSSVDLESLAEPHGLAELDVAVVPGDVAVAENGAVWVAGSRMGPHRAVIVIAEHLVLVVRAVDVVSNLHEAYDRIELERPGYGVFISGPSKTADIEQALVIGAHGARSCTVFVVG